MKFLSITLFGEPTMFYLEHLNLDPTLGAMGVEGVYPSMWEDKVGSGPTGYLIAKWIK
jgi:hypothetical protein